MISIIVPVYNCEKTISALIQSIKKQTYIDFEVILVNDGSTDNTEYEAIKEINNDCRFFIVNQENSGAPIARNNGLIKAKGEYIYLCDADDVLAPQCLEKLFNTIIREQSDIAIARYSRFEKNIEESYNHKELPIKAEELSVEYRAYFHDPIPGTKLYKKDIIDKYNIRFADVKIAQDLNFYLKYINCTNKISDIEDIVYYYRITAGSISRTYKLENLLDVKKSFYDVLNFMKTNEICPNYDVKRKYLEYVKMINYVGQLRKRKHLIANEYSKLRAELCSDVKPLNYNMPHVNKILFNKIIEYYLIKYLNFNVKKF